MDLEEEVLRLSGQQAATQLILIGLCGQLRQHSSDGEAVVAYAFNYAEKVIETASPKIIAGLSRVQLDIAQEAAFATLEQLANAALRAEFVLQD